MNLTQQLTTVRSLANGIQNQRSNLQRYLSNSVHWLPLSELKIVEFIRFEANELSSLIEESDAIFCFDQLTEHAEQSYKIDGGVAQTLIYRTATEAITDTARRMLALRHDAADELEYLLNNEPALIEFRSVRPKDVSNGVWCEQFERTDFWHTLKYNTALKIPENNFSDLADKADAELRSHHRAVTQLETLSKRDTSPKTNDSHGPGEGAVGNETPERLKHNDPNESWEKACERTWNKRISTTICIEDVARYFETIDPNSDLLAEYHNLLVDLSELGIVEFDSKVADDFVSSMEAFIEFANEYILMFTKAITRRFPDVKNEFFLPHAGKVVRHHDGVRFTGLQFCDGKLIAEIRVLANRETQSKVPKALTCNEYMFLEVSKNTKATTWQQSEWQDGLPNNPKTGKPFALSTIKATKAWKSCKSSRLEADATNESDRAVKRRATGHPRNF